ncbi:MAG: hypothetical protein HY905_04205 [Deltaproteobacteria bacterium]|nr:hypothetical protein [Deltaproteobacteria bacterium]
MRARVSRSAALGVLWTCAVAAGGCATGTGSAADAEAGEGVEGIDGWDDFGEGGGEEAGEGVEGEGDGGRDDGGEPGDEGADGDDAGEAGCATVEECDDGVECTVDSCDPRDGSCKHEALDLACDDGNPCSGAETCDVVLGCLPGTPVDCSDEYDCTVDACDALTTECRHTPSHALCTAPQICDPGRGGCADPPTCATDVDCDDGDDCNGVETCGPGLYCVPGTAVVCDDGVDCTADSCDPAGGACTFTPNDAVCADADLCNGDETCDPVAGCRPGTPVDCDDGIGCTADTCTTSTGRCHNAADDAVCDDGVLCNGQEICDVRSGCAAGTPPTCSDGIACTDDRCNAGTDRCMNTPNDATCSDGLFCNGAEVCSTATGCGPGTPPACSDGVACTTDACDPTAGGGTGACVSTAPDRDRDTYPDAACTGTDCDDLDAAVHPGAAESCNAIDDDCEGGTDEAYACVRGTTMSCSTSCGSAGTQLCSNTCAWGACTPPAETCNGFDDDCLAGCDNGWECCRGETRSQGCGFCGTQTRSCGATCAWGVWGTCTGSGVCAAGGTETRACTCGGTESRTCGSGCTWGAWSGCAAGACTPAATQACTTSCGTTGSQTCSATCSWGACTPPAEVCNGADDDCDLTCDDGVGTCCRGATETASCGACATQTRTCNASCGWGAWGTCTGGGVCTPGATENRACTCGGTESRTCLGTCLWSAWSGCAAGACTPGSSRSCATGCGSSGTEQCTASCTWSGTCVPPAETCNGADDDCVAGCDNGVGECCRGGTQSQSCGFCGTQNRTCSASCGWGAWGSCTGGGVCAAGSTETRTCACGGTESRTCLGTCAWGAWSGCGSGSCTPGTTGSCTTSCLSTGSRLCQPDCTWGVCNPPAESCNGADDDCVSGCDNGVGTCCRGATESQVCGYCSTGTQSRACSATCAWGGWSACVGGGACSSGTTQACSNSCGAAGTQTCSPSCAWGTCCGAEVCGNTCDDDCDGLTNEGCSCTGDTCACTLTVAGAGGTYTGTTSGMANNTSGSCASSACPDVVYSFTPTTTGTWAIDTNGSGFDTVLYVHSAGCPGTQIACDDDSGSGNQSRVLVSLTAGTTYYVFVDGYNGLFGCASGSYTLHVYLSVSGGDTCAAAPAISGAGTWAGDTCALAADYDGTCAGTGGRDAVFAWTAPSAGTWNFDLQYSAYDTVIYVRSASCTGTQVGCDDDYWAVAGASYFSASLSAGLYYVFVDGYGSTDCGAYQLDIY